MINNIKSDVLSFFFVVKFLLSSLISFVSCVIVLIRGVV